MKIPAFFLTILLWSCFIISCKKGFDGTSFSDEELGRYIAARVPDVIDPLDPVRIRFAVAPDTTKGADVFSFHPSTKGKLWWEDEMTLAFLPDEGWKPATTYQLQVMLDKIISEVDPDMKRVVFDFTVRPVGMLVSFEPLVPEFEGDQPSYFLRGRIVTSIPIDTQRVEKMVSIKSTGKIGKPMWTHQGEGKVHEVIISDISPDATLDFSWDGKSIGANAKGDRSIRIPKANELSVLSFEPGTDGERKVSIYFSQKLHSTQDIEGLVTINGSVEGFTLRKQDHVLSVYPAEELTGPLSIMLQESIKSSRDHALGQPVTLDVSLDDANPGVRLTGTGVITPGNTDVVFPFEAINLRSVQVEVVRIFENNILQYLQRNSLEDQWGLEPVGRIIYQGTVDLMPLADRDNKFVWTRYALDLGPLVKLAPGSIYQVRLGFERDDTYLLCANNVEVEEDKPAYGELATIWEYDYGYEGFNWEHTDDPCYPAYYNPQRFVSRNLLASDIGLTAKQNDQGKIWVFASALGTVSPMSGIQIEIFDYQQQSIGKATTQANGSIVLDIPRKASFVVATMGNQKGYLRMMDGLSLNLSEFNTGGTGYQQGLRGYIYGERDVWRPGDSIHLNFILWDPEKKIDARHPVKMTVTNPLGQRILERTSPISVGGIYDLGFVTNSTDPTGHWMVKVQAGDAVFTKSLQVEAIKPNRLRIDTKLPEMVAGYKSGEDFELEAAWLFGAPASNLKAVVEAQFSSLPFSPEGFRDFRFTDPARRTQGTVISIFDGQLDATGHARVKVPVASDYTPEGQMTMALKTRVFEASGDFSSDRQSTVYHPYDHYAGVSIPSNRWGYEELRMHKANDIRLASVTTAGKGAAGRSLTVGVYNAEWRWWWDQTDESITQYNSELHMGAITTDTLVTGGNGTVTYKFTPQSYGSYLIRVCDTESGHCSGQFFYAGSWGDPTSDQSGASQLTFAADKPQYEVGDEITLKVPSVSGSRLLLTIEKNNKVLSSEWYPSTGDQTEIKLKATAEMMPNVYAFVTHIQPYEHPGNDMPLRMYGVVPIMVADPKTMLHPQINVPDALHPDKSFTVTVSEKDKLPMAYTIAVVDEGILGLTRFKSPDPWAHFHKQEALAVQTWDLFDQVLGGYGGTIDRLLSIGGDDAASLVDAPQAERFKPVIMHFGPFYLDPGQSKTHTLKMPNYVGAVRTMVVASDRQRWGATDKTSTVKADLMIQPTLPRLVSPGETITLPVNIYAMNDQIRTVDLHVKTNDMATVSDGGVQSISFSGQGDKMVYFSLKIPERPGLLKVDVSATAGSYSANQSLELDVRIPNPPLTKVEMATVQRGSKYTGTLALPGMKGTNKAFVELSVMPSINFNQRLQYLIQYPYGCLEQTLSSVFPQLYLPDLVELTPAQQQEVKKNVQGGIHRLKGFSLPSGGFTYWRGERNRDPWTNSYAGHFLIAASKAGYEVDQVMMDAWRNAQKKDAQAYRPGQFYRDDLNQAYRLYTLALDGQPAWGLMNRLRMQKELDIAAAWMLAAAYALGNRSDVASEMVTKLSTEVKPYQELSYTYGSDLRDKAIILETYLALGKQSEAMLMARQVATSLSSEYWYSTQSTSFALLAMGKMAKQFSGKTISATITQNGKTGETINSTKGIVSRELDVSAKDIVIDNKSGDPLFIRITTTGRPLKGVTTEIKNNLSLKAKYMDMKGQVISPDRLRQGQDFVVQISVTNPGTFTTYLDQLALAYLFPSGWEMANQRLDQFGERFNNSYARYQDIRDDRVNTFFSLDRGVWTYHFVMTAAYKGKYWMPDIMCEAMYSHQVQARLPGRWVEVL